MSELHYSEKRTERLVEDLLYIQGWNTSRPPKGRLLRQNEYKSIPHLNEVFKGKSKTGTGDGYPDFLIVADDFRPQIVIETKPRSNQITSAIQEATFYADACLDRGFDVLSVGVAGQERDGIAVEVAKHLSKGWESIKYNQQPISWIPRPEDTLRLLSQKTLKDLAPTVPQASVLAEKAEQINRLLRESKVKDEYRPAYVGAIMLAMWKAMGDIRRSPEFIISDINNACVSAFNDAGKSDLAASLHIDEANDKLANNVWKILSILEKLNVTSVALDHDYLGQLYETFFRYTGGNTIGQYFTPRHIARFMADICETTSKSIIIDPACGTGGFLIQSLSRAVELSNLSYEKVVDMVRHRLIGYETEPITAALCVANMILRGDGKSGIRCADSLTAKDYPKGKCSVALSNPPFPHKKTDTPIQQFVERGLEALHDRGKLAVIVPTSIIVKKNIGSWREKILRNNTLLGVCQLPDEVFQPFASANTSIVILEKGIPHNKNKDVSFIRIQDDGLVLKKGTRVPRRDGKNDLVPAQDAFLNHKVSAGFSGLSKIRGTMEWSPGAYIPSAIPSEDELKVNIDQLLRRLSSFYTRYAKEIALQRKLVVQSELIATPYREMLSKQRLHNMTNLFHEKNTIGGMFDIAYGQKELHSRDGIPLGDTLIISPTEQYNGCYGWRHFPTLISPPFITVASTGTIGEAFVQLEPCAVNDDCLILLPKDDEMSLANYFICAAIIRAEKWRFSYGRKITPQRIAEYKM